MRSFMVLVLVAAASAGLLPNPGYDYGVGHSTGQIVSTNAYGNALSTGTVGSLVTSGSYGTGGTTVVGLSALDSVPQTVEYSKQFYHFTAPEEEHHHGHTQQQLSNVLKKNLQVVFIKAPENNAATNAALQIAKQAIEQKTAIYVLSKENDASQVVGQLQQIQENVQTAPEVKFIKYRTPNDIAYAKEIIQAQYDNFDGTSQNFDGGVAPVLNYASSSGGGLGLDGLGHGVNYISDGGLSGGIKYSGIGGSSLSNLPRESGTVLNTNANYLPSNPL